MSPQAHRVLPWVVIAAFGAVAALVVLWFPYRERESALGSLVHKTDNEASLVAYTIAPAVDFGDREAVEEALLGVARDADFVGVAAYAPDGVEVARVGDPSSGEGRVHRVVDIELARGVRGSLALTTSTARIDAESRERRFEAASIAAIVLAFGLLVALFVARSFREIAVLVDAAESARRAAEDANEVKSRFLANMSHEMRTPLNGILGLAEILGRRLEGEPADLVRTLSRSARTLLALVTDLLDLSRVEAGKMEMELTPVDVEAVGLAVVETFLPACREKDLEVTVDVHPEVPRAVSTDPLRFEQILTNLVGNAVKFTARGTIGVSLQVANDELVVAVRDTGIGIPEDHHEAIFDAFTQADSSTTRRFGGSGLGLTISRQLAHSLGGELTVASRPQLGSTFSLALPLLDATRLASEPAPHAGRVLLVGRPGATLTLLQRHAERLGLAVEHVSPRALPRAADSQTPVIWDGSEPAPTGEELAALERALRSEAIRLILHPRPFEPSTLHSWAATVLPPCYSRAAFEDALRAERASGAVAIRKSAPPGLGLCVLLAEDDETNRLVASSYFEELGLTAEIVVDGREAANRVTSGTRYDLVFLDCQMPVLDGYEAARSIRGWERETGARPVPIIAITAHALARERARAADAGMSDYLTKPLSLEALRAALRRHAPKAKSISPPPPSAPVSVGILTQLRGQAGLLAELTRTFEDSSTNSLSALAKGLEHHDVALVRHHAHKLKGSCLALGAADAARHADALETLALAGSLTGATEVLIALEVAVEDVRTALSEARAEDPASAARPRAVASRG